MSTSPEGFVDYSDEIVSVMLPAPKHFDAELVSDNGYVDASVAGCFYDSGRTVSYLECSWATNSAMMAARDDRAIVFREVRWDSRARHASIGLLSAWSTAVLCGAILLALWVFPIRLDAVVWLCSLIGFVATCIAVALVIVGVSSTPSSSRDRSRWAVIPMAVWSDALDLVHQSLDHGGSSRECIAILDSVWTTRSLTTSKRSGWSRENR